MIQNPQWKSLCRCVSQKLCDFFDEICMTDLSMAFSKDVKNLVILFSVSNLGSCSDEMGWFMVQNMSTNFEVFSKSSMLDAKFCGLWRVAWYAFIKKHILI